MQRPFSRCPMSETLFLPFSQRATDFLIALPPWQARSAGGSYPSASELHPLFHPLCGGGAGSMPEPLYHSPWTLLTRLNRSPMPPFCQSPRKCWRPRMAGVYQAFHLFHRLNKRRPATSAVNGHSRLIKIKNLEKQILSKLAQSLMGVLPRRERCPPKKWARPSVRLQRGRDPP